tara:strand:- start:5121 stop:7088 length:1968 start_codon:yes stop_codon:yes gene_type:complete
MPNNLTKNTLEKSEDTYRLRLEEVERNGIENYLSGETTYNAIKNGSVINPDKIAIEYMSHGDCFDEKNIPNAAKSVYSKVGEAANPYCKITFRALFSKVTQCANLLNDIGVQKDDVVSLILPNYIETHIALWGAEAAGIVNPINPLLEANVIRDILNEAGAKVVIALGDTPGNDIWQKVSAIKDQIPTLETILVLYGESCSESNIINFETTLEQYPDKKLTSKRIIKPEDSASMFHTGGTTGTPKIAVHTHANEVANAAMLATSLSIKPSDKALVGLPLFHVNAAIATGLMPLSFGASIILAGPSGFRTPGVVANFFKIIEHNKVSFFSAVPTALGALLDVDSENCDLSSLNYGISGAAPIPVETFKQFQNKTGINLLEGYGLTEGTCVSSLTPIENSPRIGSIGMRVPFSKMRSVILDENNQYIREAKVNEIGALALSGPNVFPGYLEPKHNENLWIDIDSRPWLNSGDLCRVDEDEYFWLTGRKKELIIRGGHNIDPKSIEEPITAMVGVSLVAAVGRPDQYAGEVPIAYVTLTDPSINTEQIMAYAKKHIQERAAIPKAIHIIEQMPVTAVGKIFKPQLSWWQIEKVIKKHISEILPDIVFKKGQVYVEKHEKFGCIATISLSELTLKSTQEKLSAALNSYSIHYQYTNVNS